MKKLLIALAAALVSVSAFAQGTITLKNNGLTAADGSTYNAPITGDTTGASAQLYILSGANYVAVPGVTTFRTGAASPYLTALTIDVPGTTAGGNGTFRLRAWVGGNSWEAATTKGESSPFTVTGLGGQPASGPPLIAPNLNGMQSFALVPEPSTIALGVLGAAALLIRRRK